MIGDLLQNILGYFNSIKVRLKQLSMLVLLCFLSYFNSIKVRLKLSMDLNTINPITYFNSIKVRLKLEGLRPIPHF